MGAEELGWHSYCTYKGEVAVHLTQSAGRALCTHHGLITETRGLEPLFSDAVVFWQEFSVVVA